VQSTLVSLLITGKKASNRGYGERRSPRNDKLVGRNRFIAPIGRTFGSEQEDPPSGAIKRLRPTGTLREFQFHE
jgi:hypothetical protein